MAPLHVVSRVLMLKILLACLAGLVAAAYEFGYHPSAEEFDNLLRETRRTWTRDVLANQRRRVDDGGDRLTFVPKFSYERERNRFAPPAPWPHRIVAPSSDEPASHVLRPGASASSSADQQGASNSPHPAQIGSTLDFSMFSDEVGDGEGEGAGAGFPPNEVAYEQPQAPATIESFVKPAAWTASPPRPLAFQTHDPPTVLSGTLSPISSTASSSSSSSSTSSAISDTISTTTIASSVLHQTRWPLDPPRNHSPAAQLPIFFTNPATGIVYAITEVGRVGQAGAGAGAGAASGQPSDAIPIYVTKEQYDRDLLLLRQHYERKCSSNGEGAGGGVSAISAISGSSNTTLRPQIIRLQKPPRGSGVGQSPVPSAKLPLALHKPPPVMVPSGGAVSDQIHLPAPTNKRKKTSATTTTMKTIKRTTKRKNKGKKKKRKSNNKRRPVANLRPGSPLATTFPKVVVGTRPTAGRDRNRDPISTQLEKPAAGLVATIFSTNESRPTKPPTSSAVRRRPQSNHRISRRSVTNVREGFPRQDTGRNETLNSWRPPMIEANTTRSWSSARRTGRARRTRLAKGRRHRPNRPVVVANATEAPPTGATTASTGQQAGPTNGSSVVVIARSAASSTKRPSSRKPGATKGKKSRRRPGGATNGATNDSDDDDVDDYFAFFEDSEYDSGSDSEYDEEPAPQAKRKRHKGAKPMRRYEDDDEDDQEEEEEEDFSDLKEDVPQGNSSSAEEGADYGAMDVDVDIGTAGYDEATSSENGFGSSTKKSEPGRKRIRRRPASSDAQYYDDLDGGYDQEEDEDDDYVGGFFRMLFYPIQALMGRLFGGFDGEKDASGEDTSPGQLATYTFYNNVLGKDNPIVAEGDGDGDDDGDGEQANSFSGWFGSWFGLNRRTKKIGSTTAAPQPPPTTEEPGWFDSWFGLGEAKTTTEASVEDDDSDKWFFGWFDSTRPKTKRRRSTTTTTTPTSVPQVPILTIVDPMRNPQNWIGILAHHILNTTATSTQNPLFEAITRATSTTTENPDVPRRVSYDKYQIWRLRPQDAGQVKALEEFQQSDEGARLQWLRGPTLRGLSDVLVPPKMLVDFQGTLDFEAIAHEVLIFDVGKAIAYERATEPSPLLFSLPPPRRPTTTRRPDKRRRRNPPLPMTWNRYHEYDAIVKYLETLRLRHPQMIELLHIGRSYEGRPLIVVKIEAKARSAPSASPTAALGSRKKPKFKRKSGQANGVFIEAGTHGREWIGPATATWMISELVRLMKSNKTGPEQDFVRNTTWYVLPVLNPDGYVYSHEYDRFWKKTRSRHVSRPGGLITSAMTWLQQRKAPKRVCYGVDLDRNWSYQWGGRGSSKSPCSEFHAGPAPFSEPEAKALSEFLVDYRKQIKLYISMQAYGQIVSYPSKANASFNADKMDDLLDVAMVGTDGLRKRGSKSRYKIDSTSDLIESRSGCSDAFAAYEVGIPFAYTMQLADNGVHGYLLPSSSIESTARDAFEVVLSMVDYI